MSLTYPLAQSSTETDTGGKEEKKNSKLCHFGGLGDMLSWQMVPLVHRVSLCSCVVVCFRPDTVS